MYANLGVAGSALRGARPVQPRRRIQSARPRRWSRPLQASAGYRAALTSKPWLLDKSRGWGVHYAFLNAFYPEPQDRLHAAGSHRHSLLMERNFRCQLFLVNHSDMLTSLEKRLDHWVDSPPVGLAMERLLEILRQGIDQQLLFIRYDLCSSRTGALLRLPGVAVLRGSRLQQRGADHRGRRRGLWIVR